MCPGRAAGRKAGGLGVAGETDDQSLPVLLSLSANSINKRLSKYEKHVSVYRDISPSYIGVE